MQSHHGQCNMMTVRRCDAMHRDSKQIVAFHVGDRSRASAQALWEKIPSKIRENSLFHTDDWDSYKTVIPETQHLYTKIKKYTNHVERFNRSGGPQYLAPKSSTLSEGNAFFF